MGNDLVANHLYIEFHICVDIYCCLGFQFNQIITFCTLVYMFQHRYLSASLNFVISIILDRNLSRCAVAPLKEAQVTMSDTCFIANRFLDFGAFYGAFFILNIPFSFLSQWLYASRVKMGLLAVQAPKWTSTRSGLWFNLWKQLNRDISHREAWV